MVTIHFAALAVLVLYGFTCFGQRGDQIKLSDLHTNCVAEIERGALYGYTTLKEIKVLDYKLLAWSRIRDSRPHYADHALCWAKVATDHGQMWAVAHRVSNLKAKTNGTASARWNLAAVSDTPVNWLLFFASPPKNKDIYSNMSFKFEADEGWELYDSQVMADNWEAATGEKPGKQFTQRTAQPTPAIRSTQDTNRNSSTAGSPR